MPKYRLLHMNCRTGRRSRQLTRLEYTVWIAYMLSADDFGVCPASAQRLQADDPFIGNEKRQHIERAIETLIRVGLVGTFEDGKDRYLYQPDWQDYQKIKHPSKTSLPPIPVELLEKCSPETVALFVEHHSKKSELISLHTRACDANANATANANANATEARPVGKVLAEHDRLFQERYGRRPAKYTGKDAKHAADLIDAHGYDATIALMGRFFQTSDKFITSSGHGLGVLASGTVQNKLIAEASGVMPKNDGLDGLREFARG